MCIGLHVKYWLLLSDCNETGIFLTDFREKNTEISNFIQIRPVKYELVHAGGRTDGETDMTKLIVAFRTFTKAPKKLEVRKRF